MKVNLALLSHHETRGGAQAIEFLIKSLELQESYAAYISSQPDPERDFFSQIQEMYKRLDIDLGTYIDFETGYSDEVMDEVLGKPIVHLSGGNTYRFLHSLRTRGLTQKLVEYSKNGGVFVGVSAGAILLTSSIESAALCGDTNDIGLADLSGFGLANIMFAPHATKQPDEISSAKQLVEKHNVDLYLCNDDESIVIHENQLIEFGAPKIIKAQEINV